MLFDNVAISIIFSSFFIIIFDWNGKFELWWFHWKYLVQIYIHTHTCTRAPYRGTKMLQRVLWTFVSFWGPNSEPQLEPLAIVVLWCFVGFQVVFLIGQPWLLRDANLSDSCTPYRSFYSLAAALVPSLVNDLKVFWAVKCCISEVKSSIFSSK